MSRSYDSNQVIKGYTEPKGVYRDQSKWRVQLSSRDSDGKRMRFSKIVGDCETAL